MESVAPNGQQSLGGPNFELSACGHEHRSFHRPSSHPAWLPRVVGHRYRLTSDQLAVSLPHDGSRDLRIRLDVTIPAGSSVRVDDWESRPPSCDPFPVEVYRVAVLDGPLAGLCARISELYPPDLPSINPPEVPDWMVPID